MLTDQPIIILKCFSPERLKSYEKVIFWVQDKESTQQPKPFGPLNKKFLLYLLLLDASEKSWRTMKSIEQCYACCIVSKEPWKMSRIVTIKRSDSQHKIFSGIKVRCQITFIRILINLPLIVPNMKLYESDKQPSRILRYDKRTINIVIPSILNLCSSTLLKKHYSLL